MKRVLEMQYTGLQRIVSGGQCGTDRGALEAAKGLNVPTGGWAPLGYRTQHGPDLSLKDFGLLEDSKSNYQSRTERNIKDSDGTVVISRDLTSPGTVLTINLCKKLNKPCHIVKLNEPQELSAAIIYEFILEHSIQILNVAGNRDKVDSYNFDTTYNIITKTIILLRDRGYLFNN